MPTKPVTRLTGIKHGLNFSQQGRHVPNKSYSAYVARKEGLGARIDCITTVDQPRADHFAELILFATLFSLPYEDAVRQALTMQANLTLQQAREAMVRVDTGAKLHLATESAHAASASCMLLEVRFL